MDDSDKRGGALILGFGSEPEGEEKGELPMLLRAFTRALGSEDYDKAAELFEEAVTACGREKTDKGDGGDRNPFSKGGGDYEDDDDGGGLKF